MSKRYIENTTPEISDDDDSFKAECDDQDHGEKEVVLISSDENTIEYDQSTIEDISDDDAQLPKVKVLGNNSKIDKKQDIIRKLFPNSFRNFDESANINKPEIVEAPKIPGFTQMIGGVQVNMPIKPYGCQIALMFKVIVGIGKRENCLLESPTGSGKTLALLCGALAWQKQERDRIAKLNLQRCLAATEDVDMDEPTSSSTRCGFNLPQKSNPEELFAKPNFGQRSIYDSPQKNSGFGVDATNVLGNTCNEFNKNVESSNKTEVTIHKRRKVQYGAGTSTQVTTDQQQTKYNVTENKKLTYATTDLDEMKIERVPKIYYGARTHKQLQQVIKEFKRTAYCGVATMTILSSREYSCIREFDRHMYPSKNDMCKTCCSTKLKMRKEEGTNCKYFDNREKFTHKELPPAFDLEDLVAKGHEIMACPYYGARDMAAVAHIVFCPYNYLIDPSIRVNMQLNVTDDIVILDEAHNIEDICREAATFTLKRDDIGAAINELDQAANSKYSNSDVMVHIQLILRCLKTWEDWFHNQKALLDSKPVINKESVFKWEVEHFVKTLDNHNIGRNEYSSFAFSVEEFCNKLRDNGSDLYGVSQSTGNLVEAMAIVYTYLFRDDGKYMDDFKPALIRTTMECYEPDIRGWRNTGNKVVKTVEYLKLCCLNPGVVFLGLQKARCIILASGTLTPLLSLHSELGTKFPHCVSPKHVIARERVWVGTLGAGPGGAPLQCRARDSAQPPTQDALGAAVLRVARAAPHGVLCFLPSYTLLHRLRDRWIETGLWKKLNDLKYVFEESRSVKEHNQIMEEYYENVETKKGAILFAVYRGKVSEGMDFKDRQARVVITIGIPYPNTTELMISEKMIYNDKYTKDRNLLPSKDWLHVQAYRALNQAAGRCVRHRQDWGAVLLVDARFRAPHYTRHLSGWLRDFLGNNHHTYESLVNGQNSLESFMKHMTILQQEEDMV